MTEDFGQDTQPVAEIDEFDVEGHGLREVAMGLSAATAIAGCAGAAALALDNPLPGTTSGARAAAAGVQQDVQRRGRPLPSQPTGVPLRETARSTDFTSYA